MKQEISQEVLKQSVAATSITGAILTWWPIFFAIPGFVYYCILVYEKCTGKNLNDNVKFYEFT